ncbi:MAG: serpin family protein [Spirochaetes bacterium]|jgi:serpin B|nr:serpin family protein [Spirochaetota bacterium]
MKSIAEKISKIIYGAVILTAMLSVYNSVLFAGNAQIIPGGTDFALGIYKKMAAEGGNVLISPFCITGPFAVSYYGARGATEIEIGRVFGFGGRERVLKDWFQGTPASIEARGRSGAFKFSTADGIWIDSVTVLDPGFVSTVKNEGRAAVDNADFASDPEGSREKINEWVAGRTGGMIRGFLAPGSVRKGTRMVVASAVYFSGEWADRFDPGRTTRARFWITPSKSGMVDMMNRRGHVGYYEAADFTAVSIPYKGEGLSMVVILPKKKAGLAAVEKKLSAATWRGMIDGFERKDADLYLPRFRSDFSASLKRPLVKMGMAAAFGMKADFSGMARDLYIGDALHRACISVDEKGTEASSATGLVYMKKNGGGRKVFRADHPFLYAVFDGVTGSILFIGRFSYPAR